MATEAELAELRKRSREAWDRADYPPLGERLMPAARELVEACAVSAGQEVLDVGAVERREHGGVRNRLVHRLALGVAQR